VTLGQYPGTSLRDARAAAADALKLLVEGKSPRDVEKQKWKARAITEANTFAAVANQFMRRHAVKLKVLR
jgi:hypothetical protein